MQLHDTRRYARTAGRLFRLVWWPLMLFAALACSRSAGPEHPDIVYILADDLGYGDVSAFNPSSAWKTSHIDRIAAEGMVFSDAHSGSAVCTPTRYGILTGRYSWRTRLKAGVLWSWDEPLIGPGEPNVARLLKSHGYATACIGKWHLGLGWQYHEGTDSVDFSAPVAGGPAALGFDHFFGIAASLDIPPYVYIQNDLPTTVPTRYTEDHSEMGWWRRGLTGDDFVHEEVLPLLTEKAVAYIEEQAARPERPPFFLYFPLTAPHTPILPAEAFRGESGTNPYGDFVLQVDHTVGAILKTLDRTGLSENTLVVFTSDNGCSPYADFEELSAFGHDPSHRFRGAKADIYEGGHRIPFLVRWPGVVPPGSISHQVICLTDLMATLAAILGDTLSDETGVDSYNLLPLLEGKSGPPLREATVHHSVNGSFAIRTEHWKLIMCPGSGGWSPPRPGSPASDTLPPCQLYNLDNDPGETVNLYEAHPEVTAPLKKLLEKYIVSGRSTPGPPADYVRLDPWPGLDWMDRPFSR